MQFTTKIPIQKFQNPITYESKIMALGSCFAENMSEKFNYYKFQNTTNPFGIIFNPVSIEKIVNRIVNKIEFTENDIFFQNDLWHCYEVHSELSNPNKEKFIHDLNVLINENHFQISKLTHFQITYGTSWVYRNNQSKEIVANCHKVPQKQFSKEILSIDVIKKSIQNTIKLIQKVNPNCSFIFTVSPVRHIKDGFVENSLSKSHLIAAIHSNNQEIPSMNYFPSYEIMMDELRDYRFYAEDMLHLTQTAVDYIWIKFFENYVDEKAFATMNQVCDLQKALKHKPFNPKTDTHKKFLENLSEKIKFIENEYPFMKFHK